MSTCLALKTVTLSPAFAGGTSGGTSTFTATVDHECSLWQPTTDVNGNYTITSPYSLSAWLTWACVDPTCAVEVDLYGPNPNGGADMVVASYPSSSTTVTGNQTNYPPSGLALQTATQVTSTPPTSPPTSNLVAVDDVVTRIDIHSTVSGVKTTYTLNITRHGRCEPRRRGAPLAARPLRVTMVADQTALCARQELGRPLEQPGGAGQLGRGLPHDAVRVERRAVPGELHGS